MSEEVKNVLVIGNGYDIDHGLPTKYSHFMDFVDGNHYEYHKTHKERDVFFALSKLTEDNIWYNYFKKLRENRIIGDKWVDFEKEISAIIKHLDDCTQNLDDLTSNYIKRKPKDNNSKSHRKNILTFNECMPSDKSEFTFYQLRRLLFDDLQRLICALEVYLYSFVDYRAIKLEEKLKSQSGILDNISFDRIISFNYTHTAKTKYPNAKITYIHGECKEQKELLNATADNFTEAVKSASNANNMVLGIDEYWEDDKKDNHTNYVVFKKFVQRIQNRNDKFTTSILANAKSNPFGEVAITNIHIFGHSLDKTDKDIFEKIFTHNAVTKIFVYCYDKPTQGEYISNIIKIIGQVKLIEFIENEKMEFVILNS